MKNGGRALDPLQVGGVVAALMLSSGWLVRHFGLLVPPPGSGRLRKLLHATFVDGLVQVGAAALVVVLLVAVWRFASRKAGRPSSPGSRLLLLKLVMAVGVSFLAGEVLLRVAFRGGVSFGNHAGPMVRRFERDFRFNHYDGPSRGPEISTEGVKSGPRLLVQGDSIAWGQGVKLEQELFSSRLLEHLREVDTGAEAAVLARPGREIDGHLAQLEKWGPQIAPDVIVYQWYVNDMELDKSGRPGKVVPWRGLFFRPLAKQYSYLWFFLDEQLGSLWPSGGVSYAQYLLDDFTGDTPRWREFETVFRRWAAEATSLTPRVLVALYPHNPWPEFRFAEIHAQVRRLGEETGVETLDLTEALRVFDEEPHRMRASPFDSHPGAEAHAVMAEAIADQVLELWPDLTELPD